MLLPHRALALSRAAAHLRLVHHVVVVERRQVHQLDDRTRDGDLPGVGFRAELRGQHREQRAEPLAAGLEQMLNGLGHQLVGLAQLGGHQLLDARHPVADTRRRTRRHRSPRPRPRSLVSSLLQHTGERAARRRGGDRCGTRGFRGRRVGRPQRPRRAGDRRGAIPPRQGLRRRADPARGRRTRAARPRPMAGRPDPPPRPADVGIRRRRGDRLARARRFRRRAAPCHAPSSTTGSARSPSTTARRCCSASKPLGCSMIRRAGWPR